MIPEFYILLSVQHLQERGKGISLIVAADLVNLIQKHQRISHSGMTQSVYHAARHSAYIGFPMATDFCLIPNSAQADADILFAQSPRYRPGNGSFSRSRRSYQTDDGAGSLFRQNPYSQVFQNSLLHLFQAIVILFENFLCMF